jgi:SMC interacting uncharacterized protein involved in chromosome segregation
MNSVLDIVKCNECKFILQKPVTLPCGNAICQMHVIDHSYYCEQCGNEHIVPQNGFPLNSAISLLIDFTMVDFKRAMQAYESYKATINELESVKNEPKAEIEKKIGELKAQVRSYRDDLIDEIKLKSELVISDLDKFENECTDSLTGTENSMENAENRLEKAKLKLDSLFSEMKKIENAYQDKWKSIIDQCELEANELVNFMVDFKKSLLLYRLDDFKGKFNHFCQIKLINLVERLASFSI